MEVNGTMSTGGCILDRKWIVLAVNFLNMFLCAGFPFNMSVLNVEFLRAFGKGKAQTALVQSVTIGIMDISGFICGQCVNRYGVRKMGICGGLLAFLGLTSSFFATSIPYLIVSVGVVSGFGFSLAFVSSLTAVGEYFNGKAKLAALAFIGTGSGSGAMLIPFMLNSLIDRYGWQGCLLIMGGLMGNMIYFFAICKPKSVGVKQPKVEIWYSQNTGDTQINKKDNRGTNTNTRVFESHKKKNTGILQLKALTKNYIFIIFVIGTSLTLAGFSSALIYMVEFLKTKHFDEQDALLMYLYMNVSNTVSRLLPGICIFIPQMNILVISAILISLSCLASVGLLEATTYYQHVFLMCSFGIAIGGNETCLSLTTMELVGLENYPVAIGILMTLVGVSSIGAGAFSGWLVDATGSYHTSFYSVSSAHGLAVGLFILAAILRNCNRSQTYYIGR